MLTGTFCWIELQSTDLPASRKFYGSLFGCETSEMPGPQPYVIASNGANNVAGLTVLADEAKKMGAPPSWIGYVAVDEVDTTAERIKRLGGAVHVPPTDIPNVGRFSVVADPQAAVFSLFNSPNTCDAPLPEPGTPGHVGWHEL